MKPIVGIPMAVCLAGVICLGWATLCGCGSAQIQRVDGDFNAISSALEAYRAGTGHYPTTEQGLMALVERPTTPPLPQWWKQGSESMPRDPWNGEYQYQLLPEGGEKRFELKTAGPDGRLATVDDLSNLDPKD